MEKIRSLQTTSVSTFIASKECLERPTFFEGVVDAVLQQSASVDAFNREIQRLKGKR
jgi:3-methyladenine DNA glycosylase/8-oxoguanine DNA glycosylase